MTVRSVAQPPTLPPSEFRADAPSDEGAFRTLTAVHFDHRIASARSRSSDACSRDTHRQPTRDRRQPERSSPHLSSSIRILGTTGAGAPPLRVLCSFAMTRSPLCERVLANFPLVEGNGVSAHWFAIRDAKKARQAGRADRRTAQRPLSCAMGTCYRAKQPQRGFQIRIS